GKARGWVCGQREGGEDREGRNILTDPPRNSSRGRRLREGPMSKTLTRRTFLRVSAAGGALLVGGYIPGLREAGTAEAAGVFEPNVWVKIASDDTVTIMLSQLEMGQGVMTSMPMLVAEELDVDFNKIKTEWVPADSKYGNPNFGGAQLTAGSNSVRGMWKILRESGATARM